MAPQIKTELPGPQSKRFVELSRRYEPHSMSDQVPLVWERAEDVWITDVDGNVFLDFSSGVLVTNVGHCHPRYVEAIREQAGKLFNCYDFVNPNRVLLAEKLVQLTPPHLNKAFLLTTGCEATESCVKMARRFHEGYEILTFGGAFHGRLYGAMAFGGNVGVKRGFGPLMPGVLMAPFPYCYRCPLGQKLETCDLACIDYLDYVVKTQSTGALCAVITEPYQGGAGSIIPPPGWFERLDEWRRERGMLLIVDEVQSSFGRTGKWFAIEHWGLEPDLIALGKGLGSGVPCSAVVGRAEIMDVLKPGEMSSTNGGNPLSCAAGLAALEIIDREGLVENARVVGEAMLAGFREIEQRSPILGDVRGMGLAIGLEIVEDKASKTPAPELTKAVIWECYQRGLCLIAPIGFYGNVIRVAPPLTIERNWAEWGVGIIGEALEAVARQAGK